MGDPGAVRGSEVTGPSEWADGYATGLRAGSDIVLDAMRYLIHGAGQGGTVNEALIYVRDHINAAADMACSPSGQVLK